MWLSRFNVFLLCFCSLGAARARLTVSLAANRLRKAKELLRLTALKRAAALLVRGGRGLGLGLRRRGTGGLLARGQGRLLSGAGRRGRGRGGGGLNLSNVNADVLRELADVTTGRRPSLRIGAGAGGRVSFS
jgi:hypothetical protein